jgi:DNA-directed RNA polymerase subunit E'/Rpb7
MEKKLELTKTISILPNLIDHNIIKNVISLLKLKYEKTCNENDGMILSISNDIIDIQNIISKDSFNILFKITFLADVVKPEKGDIINFKPSLILDKGVFGKIYDNISVFIPETNMKEWKFSDGKYKKDEKIIDKDTYVKCTITDIKFNTTKYNCICSL